MLVHLLNIENILLTERTVIRRFREQDGEAFFKIIQNNRPRLEDRFRKLTYAVHSIDEATFFIHTQIANWLLQKSYSFAIWDNDSADIIGYVEIINIDWDIPKAELVFFIDQEREGREFMTEALLRIIQFAFEELKLVKINFITASDNYAAQRLIRKVGFRREGDLRLELKKASGEITDAMLLSISNQDYFKV